MKDIDRVDKKFPRWKSYPYTGGTWFVSGGAIYSQLGDGKIVRIALMDREERGTSPTERDSNCHYITALQNDHVVRWHDEDELEEVERNLAKYEGEH